MDNTVLYVGGAVATGICTVAWWAVRAMHARISENEKDLAAFKLHCAESFVTSSALEKAIDRLSDSINAVFAKLEQMDTKFDRRLDSKADK
jgi:septal ring factor EnvC (AmiA/AmiB activator)